MKKHNWLLAIAVIVLLIVGCNPETTVSGTGTLKVLINDAKTRSIESNVLLDTVKYIIQLTPEANGPAEIITEEVMSDTHEKNIQVAVGNWTITVWAQNARGEKIGEGTCQAVVSADNVNTYEVRIVERKGFGILNVRISGVYDFNNITATLQKSPEDLNPVAVNLHKVDNVYYGTEHLENGSYLMVVYLNGVPFWTEAIRIVTDGQTNADVLVSEGNKVTISQKADVVVNRITCDTLSEGGAVSNGRSYVFHSLYPALWYVDGVLVSGGESTSYTWNASGLELNSRHYIGAITGSPEFRTMATMHVISNDNPSVPIVNAVIEDRQYTAGDVIDVTYENLPAENVILNIDIGDNIGFSNYSVENWYPHTILELPASMMPGRYTLTFTHQAGPEIQIPPVSFDLVAAEFSTPVELQIQPVAYNGDGIRFDITEPLKAGVSARLYMDGVEVTTSQFGKDTVSGRFLLNDMELGTRDVRIEFYNAGNVVPVNGNQKQVEVRNYEMPEVSFSVNGPVHPGKGIPLVLSRPLDVDLDVTVTFPDGASQNVFYSSGNTEKMLFIPDFTPLGEMILNFTASFAGQPIIINPLTVQVEEYVPVAITIDAPKYVSADSWSIQVGFPDNINDVLELQWTLDGNPINENYKQIGEEYVSVYLDNVTSGTHTLKGDVRVNGDPATIKSFEFISIPDSTYYSINTSYGASDVTYGITSRIYREGTLIPQDCTITARLMDYSGVNETISLDEGVTTNWTYTGKEPFLDMICDVRDSSGALLIRNNNSLSSFQASFDGPREISIPASGEFVAKYTPVLNRSDLNFGNPFRYEIRLDNRDWIKNGEITWTRAMNGRHKLDFYAYYKRGQRYIGRINVLVAEEVINPDISLSVNGIHRSSSNPNSYIFEVDGNVPIDVRNLVFSIKANGQTLASNSGARYTQLDNDTVEIISYLSGDIPSSGSIQFNVSLLNNEEKVIQKCTKEFEVSDVYLAAYRHYERGFKSRLYFKLGGASRSERFDYYVDDQPVNVIASGSRLFIELDKLSYGTHTLVAKSASNPSRVSEAYTWKTVSDTIYEMDNLIGRPAPVINVNLQFYGDPALNLPSDVLYELWYQYPGQAKVILPPNNNGRFEIPADVADGFKFKMGYRSTCGNYVVEREMESYANNCKITGIPDSIKASDLPASYVVSLDWYNDLLAYGNYDYRWELGDTPVGVNAREITVEIPAGAESTVLFCHVSSKSDENCSTWIHKNINIIR